MKRAGFVFGFLFLLALSGPAFAEKQDARSQVVAGQTFTVSAEVVSYDSATREVVLKGPFGGTIEGVVSTDVKDVSELAPGHLVSATYYEAVAAGVRRKADEKALFTAADLAAAAQAGVPTSDVTSKTVTVTVSMVDLKTNTVVFKKEDGTLVPTEVTRPEFQAKLKDLKDGDLVDMTYSEALVTDIKPMKEGEEATVAMKMGTLVIDKGEVLKRVGNSLTIKNDAGRIFRVNVDPDFKFMMDGKEATVQDIREGTKLSRTVLRVQSVDYSE
jgi:uncharacterized protein GlcG (DUF336 family)